MDDLTELLIFALGIVFVLGIGFFIARDAKRRAPVTSEEEQEHPGAAEQHRRSTSKQARDRQKAKRARKARRYNRSR
ncbi:MAG TPA: hypothetical protein VIL49_01670 [Capillimicrobium sp.]|jgi:Mg2+/citrate symporter